MTALIDTQRYGGDDGELIGTLVVEPDGCLALDIGNDTKPIPIVWPAGSRLADDGQSMRIERSGPIVRVGDDLHWGGGVHDLPNATYADVPEVCLINTRIAVMAPST